MMPCISGLKLKEKKTPIKNMYMHTFHFVSNTTVRTENKDFEQVVGIVLLVVGNKNLLLVTPPRQLEVWELLTRPKNWFELGDHKLVLDWGQKTDLGLGPGDQNWPGLRNQKLFWVRDQKLVRA